MNINMHIYLRNNHTNIITLNIHLNKFFGQKKGHLSKKTLLQKAKVKGGFPQQVKTSETYIEQSCCL